MPRKPASMYRKITQQPYTRREYVGGVPASRITQFDVGNKSADFPVQLSLYAEEQGQIRHTALESARITANREMEKKAGVVNYRLKVRVYPHHILRENKQATGAGADRVSQGMRASFGKAVGTAARVQRNQKIMTVFTNQDNVDIAKNALRKAKMKLPIPCRTNIVKQKSSE